jgi:fructose-1,6-bisphosphatase/inositol monophosphatase family enzyme
MMISRIFRMGKKERKDRKLNAREKHEQKIRRNQQNANDESTELDKELEKQLRQVGLALR